MSKGMMGQFLLGSFILYFYYYHQFALCSLSSPHIQCCWAVEATSAAVSESIHMILDHLVDHHFVLFGIATLFLRRLHFGAAALHCKQTKVGPASLILWFVFVHHKNLVFLPKSHTILSVWTRNEEKAISGSNHKIRCLNGLCLFFLSFFLFFSCVFVLFCFLFLFLFFWLVIIYVIQENIYGAAR